MPKACKSHLIILSILLLIGLTPAYTQNSIGIRKISLNNTSDTIRLDTLSIIPNSEIVKIGEKILSRSDYFLNPINGKFAFKGLKTSDSLNITYRVFSEDYSQVKFNKDTSLFEDEVLYSTNPFSFSSTKTQAANPLGGLNSNGSISRGIQVGNSQDLIVNSNLNLQLSGYISEDVELIASISDNNIPIQPDGNTQQIQDFDQVFIQLKSQNNQLTAGDYQLQKTDGYFMRFYKRTQGGDLESNFKNGDALWKTKFSGAVAKGKATRNTFIGIEGNQGPYRLKGNENEVFIIVLAGTERVFIDGVLKERGQDRDYVMDYNTGEITFTPNQIITQNTRIIVEFEYSDLNYARSLAYVNTNVETEKLTLDFNFYSEQDSKKQPLQQQLENEEITFLSTLGDSIKNAFISGEDSLAFNADEVRYKKIDTFGFQDVYVFSTNEDDAFYRVQFSFVGNGQGNYLSKINTSNGKVFEFSPPINGEPQGTHEPVTLLITPKVKQLYTLGSKYKLAKNTVWTSELSLSKNDINKFSSIDSENDVGQAIYNKINKLWKTGDATISTSVDYELTSTNYKPLERYRDIEFQRDFNVQQINNNAAEQYGGARAVFQKDSLRIGYGIRFFDQKERYNGLKNIFDLSNDGEKLDFTYDINLLNANTNTQNIEFLRQNALIELPTSKIVYGLEGLQDRNLVNEKATENISLSSFHFYEAGAFIRQPDTAINTYKIGYKRRYDYLPDSTQLLLNSYSNIGVFQTELKKNPKSILRLTSTYRELKIVNILSPTDQSQRNILGRVDYNATLASGLIRTSSFYEVSSGREQKREFLFIEVPVGQGTYNWVDYNNNGIKELNEFEIAQFPDQRKYLRVFTPSNEFINTQGAAVSEVFYINPAAILKGNSIFSKVISTFSNNLFFLVNKKTTGPKIVSSFNPLVSPSADSLLVTLVKSFKNTFYFNRTNPIYGAELTYSKNENKTFLSSGFDVSNLTERGARVRWRFIPSTEFSLSAVKGINKFNSDFFVTRSFNVNQNEFSPVFDIQLDDRFNLILSYKRKQKTNSQQFGGEELKAQSFGLESKYNFIGKGLISGGVNLINNNYIGQTNTPVSYQLLDGLQAGTNYTWNVSVQRNLNENLQISLSYDGRKSEATKAINTGSLTARALF